MLVLFIFSVVIIMNSLNEQSKEILRKYVNQALDNHEKSNFFILNGPKGIGKSEVAYDISKDILGKFFYSDFKFIQDFSDKIGKKHILKIEYDDGNEITKQLKNDFEYSDIGVREISDWLSKTSFGKYKILLIENIERMNGNACNAFLKTCEETLPNRVILATTSNISSILPTISSRAITINFYADSYQDLLKLCEDKGYFSYDKSLREFVCFMCLGKSNFLGSLQKKLSENEDLKNVFGNVISVIFGDDLTQKYKLFSTINKNGFLQDFLDGLIAYCVHHDMFQEVQRWMYIKKFSTTNVNIDHLLLSLLL